MKASKNLDPSTLEIKDLKQKRLHEKEWFPEINKLSKWIVYSRVVYALFILFQFIVEGVDIRRPLQYLSFTIFHYLFMLLCKDFPIFQKYHAPVVTITFASFILLDPSLYGKT